MRTSEHPVFGRIFIFLATVGLILFIAISFFKLNTGLMSGVPVFIFLILGIGFALYLLGFCIFSEDIDIQIWMDEYVFQEPRFYYLIIFHFVLVSTLLFLTHVFFLFYKLLAKPSVDEH